MYFVASAFFSSWQFSLKITAAKAAASAFDDPAFHPMLEHPSPQTYMEAGHCSRQTAILICTASALTQSPLR